MVIFSCAPAIDSATSSCPPTRRASTFGQPEKKMGLHGSHTYAVSLEDVRVPAENLLGVEGRGLAQTMQVLDGGRIGIGALSLGLAEAALEAACAYARQRQAFGQPLAQHEAVAFMLADMATEIEAARWLVYHAAWLKDQGRPFTKRSFDGQAVRQRGRRTRRPQRDPDPRRQRLQPGIPGRAHLSRRPADDDRRRDQRNAAAGDLRAWSREPPVRLDLVYSVSWRKSF